jgi:hypothetical protein
LRLVFQALRQRLFAVICCLQARFLAVKAHELGDRLGALQWIVCAAKEVLSCFALPGEGLVEHDDAAIDRDFGESRAGHPVPAGACQLPAAVHEGAHIDGVNLPVALHGLTDRRCPGGVDRPQALAKIDLVRVDRNDVAGIGRGNAAALAMSSWPPDLDGARRPTLRYYPKIRIAMEGFQECRARLRQLW